MAPQTITLALCRPTMRVELYPPNTTSTPNAAAICLQKVPRIINNYHVLPIWGIPRSIGLVP